MMQYNLFTPGIFLILASIPLSFVSKRFFRPAAVVLLLLSYLVLCVGMNKWNFYWYEQFLFSDERVLFILTSLFFLVLFLSTIIFADESHQSSKPLALAFVYVGSTVSILFTKNLLCILFFLELMMLSATLILFSNRDELSKRESLNYFRLHMIGSALLLLGVMSYYYSYDTFELDLFDNDSFHDFSSICLVLGLLVNLAVPPFSSWLLGSYIIVPPSLSLLFAICTTKISALLLMKLFAGWHALIFIGIITAAYGTIYSIFENNIRRTILYFILAEIGVTLIFIGIGEKTMTTALLFIINDLLCIPTILCSGNLIIRLFKKENFSEIRSIPNNSRLIILLNSIALLSIAAAPFTLGYISKQYLYSTEYLSKAPWLSSTLSLLCGGIVFAIGLKFTVFTFFKNPTGKQHKKSLTKGLNVKTCVPYIFALTTLYASLIALTAYFIMTLGMEAVEIDDFSLKQVQSLLAAGVIFSISKKYIIYAKDMYSLDPNILYLKAGSWINTSVLAIRHHLNRLANTINLRAFNIKPSAHYIKRLITPHKMNLSLALSITLLIIALLLKK
jgi:multicomponent Na+:H+ antiporter subunit D